MENHLLLLTSVVLSLAAIFGTYLLARIRAAGRLRAATDAYADREIAREELWRDQQKVAVPSRRKGVLAG